MTRVLVVDPHRLVRRGLAAMIDAEPDLQCCGEAGPGADALEAIARCSPDIVLIDVSSQGGAGLALLPEIRRMDRAVRVVAMAVYNNEKYVERVFRAGAAAFTAKSDVAARVLETIRRALRAKVRAGGRPPTIVTLPAVAPEAAAAARAELSSLDRTEREIVQLTGRGVPARAIAVRLGLSVSAVEANRRRISGKLRLSATEWITFCVRWAERQRGLAVCR